MYEFGLEKFKHIKKWTNHYFCMSNHITLFNKIVNNNINVWHWKIESVNIILNICFVVKILVGLFGIRILYAIKYGFAEWPLGADNFQRTTNRCSAPKRSVFFLYLSLVYGKKYLKLVFGYNTKETVLHKVTSRHFR